MAWCIRSGIFAAVVAGLVACNSAASSDTSPRAAAPRIEAAASAPVASGVAKPIPRLVDLGAGKCIPCKAMAPILDQLRTDYAGKMEVVFIDVWKQPEAGQRYGIQMIPTQIFYAADGRELARHEGFIDREGILGAWARLGVAL